MKAFLTAIFIVVVTPLQCEAAACSAARTLACIGAFNVYWGYAQLAMKTFKDQGHFTDQGHCEEVGRDVGELAGVIGAATGVPAVAASALVAAHCGECLCRDIY
jgi:hypothetical protein